VPSLAPGMMLGPADATTGTVPGGYAVFDQWPSTSTGNVTQIRVKANAAGNVKVALYADNAGTPGALLQAVNVSTPVVAGWNTITIPATAVVSGTNYWLATATNVACLAYQAAPGTLRKYVTVNYATYTFTASPAGGTSATGFYDAIAGWGN
jgi:hypothetical protein